jgi:hypothetical protein
MNLVQRLSKEHVALQASFNDAYNYGITTDEGRRKLHETKALLLGHLAAEDKELYPALDAAAATDPRLAALLKTLRTEMTGISAEAIAFFETYGAGGSGFGFARDFGRLSAALGSRIRREETTLFPEFLRIAAK